MLLFIPLIVFVRTLSCAEYSVFTLESCYCFQRVLAIAILSVRLSVLPFVTRVDQSKAVQARITKFSPSAAWNYRYAIQIVNLVFVY